MDWFSVVIELLFGGWWYGKDGRAKTANAADSYLMPVLMVLLVGCLLGVLVYAAGR